MRADDTRSFVRGLVNTGINLRPDTARGQLRIELNGQTNPTHEGVVNALCNELNTTEFRYPVTVLRLKYAPLWSAPIPACQDV